MLGEELRLELNPHIDHADQGEEWDFGEEYPGMQEFVPFEADVEDVDSPTAPTVSVVVPTYNEKDNLTEILPRLGKVLEELGGEHEVIIVDGRSTDGTIEEAQRLLPNARIVLQGGKGKGDAINYGFDAAEKDIIVMLDADGSALPEEIPAFVDAIKNGADFAKGTRFAEGGGSSDITALRGLGNRALNGLTNVLNGTRFTDLCYGYNAFRREACLPAIGEVGNGFEVETQILIRVARAGLNIVEVGSFEADRIHGESNLNTFRDGSRVLRAILKESFASKLESEASQVAAAA